MRLYQTTTLWVPIIVLSFAAGRDSSTNTDKIDKDAKGFVHPGILHTTADLECMGKRAAAVLNPISTDSRNCKIILNHQATTRYEVDLTVDQFMK